MKKIMAVLLSFLMVLTMIGSSSVFADENLATATDKVSTGTMYRLYNPNGGEHFYTCSLEEKDWLVSLGWNYEGEGFKAPTTGDPVYRLYHETTGSDHLYTMDWNEVETLKTQGWNYEGIAWYSAPTTGTPVYRLLNPNATTGTHHFTTSKEERDWLISLGWVDQGVGWYSEKNDNNITNDNTIVYEGSGDDVIQIKEFDGLYVFDITGNAEDRYFGIVAYGDNNKYLDLLVNTAEPYSGTVYSNKMQDTKLLKITATGSWRIVQKSIASCHTISQGQVFNGYGDDVLVVNSHGSTATISGNSTDRYFGIISYDNDGDYCDLLVNTADPYQGTVMLDNDTYILEINAVGSWTITLN